MAVMSLDALVGAIQTSATLGSVLQPSFGPNGLDVMLEGSDGHVSCSGCGRQILASLQLSHPLSISIIKAVAEYHSQTGDGTKKMVLILQGVLEKLASFLSTKPLRQAKIEVSQALRWVDSNLLGLSQVILDGPLYRIARTPEDLQTTLSHIISTSYSHRYGHTISQKLKEILTKILLPPTMSTDINTFQKHLQFLSSCLPLLLLLLPGHPVSTTLALSGFVLDRDLAPSVVSEQAPSIDNSKRLKSLLLLDWSDSASNSSQNPVTISTGSVSRLHSVMKSASDLPQTAVPLLHIMNIQLILCGSRVPPGARQRLRESYILLVEMVPEDLLQVVAETCDSYPLEDVFSAVSSDVDPSVDLSLSSITMGTKRFLHLQCLHATKKSPVSAIVCAPSAGLCRKLRVQITDTLRVVTAWCRETNAEGRQITAVAGGGAWEIAMIRQLDTWLKESRASEGTPKWITIKALQKGLMAVPHTLLLSSQSAAAAKSRHTTLSLYTRALSSPIPMGVNCVEGTLEEVTSDWRVWEPFWSQCQLMHSVTTLLQLLLRVDCVTATRRLRHERGRKEAEEEGEEED